MGFQIRAAVIEDVPTLAAFNVAMASETEDRELNLGVVRQGVQAVLRRPELGRYFVADEAGQVIGQLMLTYEWSDWRNGTFWWIQSVYVRPDRRRHGVFRALYRHVEQVASGTGGVCGLRLYVDHQNERAMATYVDLGMSPSGHAVYETDWVFGARKP